MVAELEYMPSNKGYIVGGQKIYGDLANSNPQRVELLDVETDKVHVWHRHGHTVYVQEVGKDKASLQYETSNQMLPCPKEAKEGFCSERFQEEHHKFFYHDCHGRPRFHQGKPVCRYSQKDQENLCWERYNAEHNKNYHHC